MDLVTYLFTVVVWLVMHMTLQTAFSKSWGHDSGRIWVPPPDPDVTNTLMGYFEKFIELKKVQKGLGMVVFELLAQTYAAAGKKFPGMRHR